MEREDTLRNKKLRPKKVGDPESYKVRKGKIGGFVDYLSAEDIEYCNQMLTTMHCPFGYAELVNEEKPQTGQDTATT